MKAAVQKLVSRASFENKSQKLNIFCDYKVLILQYARLALPASFGTVKGGKNDTFLRTTSDEMYLLYVAIRICLLSWLTFRQLPLQCF